MHKNQPRPLYASSKPIVPGIPDPTCPILVEVKTVLEKTQDLHRAIRKLRRSSQRCSTCPENAECASMQDFSHAVDIAIRELRQEWGLDKE